MGRRNFFGVFFGGGVIFWRRQTNCEASHPIRHTPNQPQISACVRLSRQGGQVVPPTPQNAVKSRVFDSVGTHPPVTHIPQPQPGIQSSPALPTSPHTKEGQNKALQSIFPAKPTNCSPTSQKSNTAQNSASFSRREKIPDTSHTRFLPTERSFTQAPPNPKPQICPQISLLLAFLCKDEQLVIPHPENPPQRKNSALFHATFPTHCKHLLSPTARSHPPKHHKTLSPKYLHLSPVDESTHLRLNAAKIISAFKIIPKL